METLTGAQIPEDGNPEDHHIPPVMEVVFVVTQTVEEEAARWASVAAAAHSDNCHLGDLQIQVVNLEVVLPLVGQGSVCRALLLELVARFRLIGVVQASVAFPEQRYVSSPDSPTFVQLHHRVVHPFRLSCKRIARRCLCSLGIDRSYLRLRRQRLQSWSRRRSRSLWRGRLHLGRFLGGR